MARPTTVRSPRLLILLVALTSLALLAFFAFRFLADPPPTPSAATPPAAEQSVRASASSIPIDMALDLAGVDSVRLRRSGARLVLETSDSPEAIVRKLRQAYRDCNLKIDGSVVEVGCADRLQTLEIESIARPKAPSRGSGPGRIAVILDDAGFDLAALDRVLALDAAVTLSVLPYAPFAAESARRAAAEGLEVLCHLPMEPLGYPGVDPGPGAITTAMSDEAIRDETLRQLRSVPYAIGVNNHMGSRATADPRVMRAVTAALAADGRFFVDSRTSSRSVGLDAARALGLPSAARSVFLDDDPSRSAVGRQIEVLKRVAESEGAVIAIGHLYPSTLDVLTEEIPAMRESGFVFIPVSEAVALRAGW